MYRGNIVKAILNKWRKWGTALALPGRGYPPKVLKGFLASPGHISACDKKESMGFFTCLSYGAGWLNFLMKKMAKRV